MKTKYSDGSHKPMTGNSEHTGWEHFDHKADIGIRGVGTTLASAFEQAALAMSAVITPLEGIAQSIQVDIKCSERDSAYRNSALESWAMRVRRWRDEGRDVHVYFDNDAEGHAPRDAKNLSQIPATE